ncbi:MAG: phosphatidate cytidylyltransferase [Holosporales bacterium]|jgi:phosphatidate cytidylyltransferase|nr:phosphatidate cytidylyltransferase [Holosporales bacterium]
MVSNLTLRLNSAFITGLIAVGAVFLGGLFFQIFILICWLLMIYEWLLANSKKKSFLFFIGIFYISFPMSFWIYEAQIFPQALAVNIGWPFIIACSCDIFAYFGGIIFKGPKFAPKISPQKTWSGVTLGSLSALTVSSIYILEFMKFDIRLFICSIFMVMASILGDLLESKVKRVIGMKDMGSIIPGHGGVCDRLDSFLSVTYAFIILKFTIL